MVTEYFQRYWIFGLGFFAQSLFGMRILVQWWIAEKKQHAVSPTLFWMFSLAGAALFLVYGVLRHDVVIILGQLVAYFIYIRNLQLKGVWSKFGRLFQIAILTFPGAMIVWIITKHLRFDALSFGWNAMLVIGIVGQLLLNFRFIYQLYYSEKHKASLLPIGFWWMSLIGSLMVLAYAAYKRDPVLIVAQGLAIVPYIRNIVLSNRSVKTGELNI
ncbi:MAG TPA: lipid-A-disaccharide synthase N-terminal domain-containing protein [Chryseolinea sp.]|nr:lipid-A-disaccharide synthase N-terminal domain-containing protein [Chryseolinea sp.]